VPHSSLPEITDLDDEFDTMATPVVIDGRHAIDRRDGTFTKALQVGKEYLCLLKVADTRSLWPKPLYLLPL
jgi:hypothetical protein